MSDFHIDSNTHVLDFSFYYTVKFKKSSSNITLLYLESNFLTKNIENISINVSNELLLNYDNDIENMNNIMCDLYDMGYYLKTNGSVICKTLSNSPNYFINTSTNEILYSEIDYCIELYNGTCIKCAIDFTLLFNVCVYKC